MWKRLQQRAQGNKEPSIGRPQLIETTYQDGNWDNMPSVSNAQNSNYQVSITAGDGQRPPMQRNGSSKDGLAELPQLPFRSLAPRESSLNDLSRASMAPSSVYSQPSPEANNHRFPPPDSTLRPISVNVSEPSTRPVSVDQGDWSPVSPVESTGSASKWKSSRIPVRKLSETGAKDATRWDDWSGEPTTKDSGRSGQVRPGAFEVLHGSTSSNGSSPSGPAARATVKERAAKLGANQSIPTDTRPPWKGASGRQMLVEQPRDKPVREKPLPVTTPLSIPLQKQRKPTGPQTRTPNKNAPTSPRNVSGSSETGPARYHDTQPVSSPMVNEDEHDDDIKPVVPLKVTSPTSAHFTRSNAKPRTSYPSPVSPNNGQNNIGSTEPSPFPNRQSSMESHYLHSHRDNDPPTSRFSWSTHATGTTYQQQSPPPSPPPPMPKLSNEIATPPSPPARTTPPIASAPGSVLSRSRPVPSSNSNSIGRKPVPSREVNLSTPTKISLNSDQDNSNVLNGKALPLSPPELQGKDLITTLQQQSDDLERRRFNVEKLVSDLESPRHRNPLQYDLRAQREIERRIKTLKTQAEELRREEHDVGLRLHRAWKKRDDSEDATLWVRRIAM
ncbi:hypothetical protein EV356DRAFT_497744 [Viridothelium virens]|uniref:Uncharacterized protein n=1 Tax=Viridothelium virens TaxID=1048519 RepID=A0A6A6HFG8_VIRVR|nr:hypothetical protein EV356DRAFT_497744 [Viridothelium virens]